MLFFIKDVQCCDCGTENGVVAVIQPYLRHEVNSFRYVKSVSNQVQHFILHFDIISLICCRELGHSGQF